MSEESGGRGIAAIRGTHDILPEQARDWQSLEAAAREVFERSGYREIRTPILEATELFVKGTGETSDVVTKEMYTFTDKGGRSVTLRPEYTPSIARAIIEHRLDLRPEPMRYYYMGPMFRYDKPQKGRYRQFHQIDVEVFGESDPAVDAEIIVLASDLLAKLGVAGFEVLVNSVGCPDCRRGYNTAIRAAAARDMERLCPDCRRKAELNPLRIFDCKVEACREIAASFPSILDYLCEACRANFEATLGYLDAYALPYRVEPRLVRGLDYYTRVTFEIVTGALGAQNAICGGGRYDNLMKDYGGPDIPATGFAMGMERLLAVVRRPPETRPFLYVAWLGEPAKREAMVLARRLRGAGLECLLEFKARGLKAQLSRAAKLGAAWTLIIGENEIGRGRYPLKDMATGEQADRTPEEIEARLGGRT